MLPPPSHPAALSFPRARLCAVLVLAAALLGLSGAAPGAAPGEEEILHIDGAATRVEFSLRLLLVRKLEGRFPLVDGEVRLQRAQGTASIDVRIDTREVMMERAAWSEWARSPEFFDSLRHPWVQFRAPAAPLELFEHGGLLHGELTLRGITRAVALELLPSACSAPGRGCPVRAQGELDRSAFGMTARRVVLGDKVRLAFEIRVAPAAGPAQ